MGYVLEGVLARADALPPEMRRHPAVALGQQIVLLPMTDELRAALTVASETDRLGFGLLPAGSATTLATWSKAGPLAYVEADFFGGVGFQRAAVWFDGDLVLGPISVEPGKPAAGCTPISQALRALGVVSGGHEDEFDAVGLGRHRETDDWLTSR
ncbi:hypothetical protein [Pseudonocardia sp. TRM90224]|uniref:hypothetical protein n=1 Tax=Pseudonocardia sp. TRM90224 TaxID=2812678 RepID=UPI001E47BCCA|nr:hypothetical protein [Pseudonocardia sp. TRM90224]